MAGALGLPFSVRRVGSLLNVYFTEESPGANLLRPDTREVGWFHLASLNHGRFFPSRGMLVLSTVMTDADLELVAERAGAALADVAAERRATGIQG